MISTRMFGNSPGKSYLHRLNKNIMSYGSRGKSKGLLSNIYSSQQSIYNNAKTKQNYITNYQKSHRVSSAFPKLSLNTSLLKRTLTNKKSSVTSFLNKSLSYNPPRGFMNHSFLGRSVNIIG